MDHSEESKVIAELQATLDKRVAEWNAEVASEKRVMWMILGPFVAIFVLGGLIACCGGLFGMLGGI